MSSLINLRLRRIVTSDAVPEDLFLLYEEAFPLEERRDREQLFTLIEKEGRMFFCAIEADSKLNLSESILCGFLIYWKFPEFYYLEHFSVFSHLRNLKIGKKTLSLIEKELPMLRLLEVEPAANELSTRRVSYYQRSGYEILTKEYVQLSYRGEESSLRLWIMGSETTNHLKVLLEMIRLAVYINPLTVS
ncbi:MAG: GNAT family N-acetyltransferase [Bacteroidaceae bacterium]|nr:GNAT family N-acetyltransferase [Bacteroidaceae bacterium]